MPWKMDVLEALREERSRSERGLLVTFWRLWRDCDITIRNLFEAQRVEIAQEVARQYYEELDYESLHFELFDANDRDLVRRVAVISARLDEKVASRVDWLLRSVQVVSHGDRHFYLARRPVPTPAKSPRLKQGYPLRSIFRHMKVIPDTIGDGVHVHVEDLYPQTIMSAEQMAALYPPTSCFQVVSGGFTTPAQYNPTVRTAPGQPTKMALDNIASGGEKRLEALLTARSVAKDTHTLMTFPELSIDRRVSDSFRRHLRKGAREQAVILRLVCPGTFHARAENGGFRNTADLYDVDTGRNILSQYKLRFFKDTESDPPIDEDIQTSDAVINIRPTPLGLIGILICRDFGDETARSMLKELDIDYLLVPSMGRQSTSSMTKEAAAFFCRETGATVGWAMQTPPISASGAWTYCGADDLERCVFYLGPDGKFSTCTESVYP